MGLPAHTIVHREYQTYAVQQVFNYFVEHPEGWPLVAMPTGTGKSVVIALFIQLIMRYQNQRVLIVTHSKELVGQNYEKLLSIWPNAPAGIHSAGLKKSDTVQPIIFCGIGSVYKKAHLFGKIDIVIIDEAHRISLEDQTMYNNFFDGLKKVNPSVRGVGLTATWWRQGQGKLTDDIEKNGKIIKAIFHKICVDMTTIEAFNWLVAKGYLAPLISRPTDTQLPIEGVKVLGGDYIQGQLEKAVNKTEITFAAIQEALILGHDRNSWLVFTTGVQHCIDTAEIMNSLGIPTVAIHSKLTDKERDEAIADFKSGKYRAATNNNILTTGFDHPPIDLILVLRPTLSSSLWVQMLGRGTRPCDDKTDCLVLDYARNTRKLGPINDPVISRPKGKGGGGAPVKECPECGCDVHASLRVCNGKYKDGTVCIHEFDFSVKIVTQASTEAIMKGSAPITKEFRVDHITFEAHYKTGSKPSIRVTYYCGLKRFNEFVCLEHPEPVRSKAGRWWRERGGFELPDTVENGLEIIEELNHSTHLRIWMNPHGSSYPSILAHCFDGTGFGKNEDGVLQAPTKKSHKLQAIANTVPDSKGFDQFDDDIPF